MMHDIFLFLESLGETYGNGYVGFMLGQPVAFFVSFILSSIIFFLPFGMVIKIIKGVFDI